MPLCQQQTDGTLPPVYPPKLFPFCLVWTTIPLISWIFPFVGHLGICTSEGVTLDFAGPQFVSVDSFGFGSPTRYGVAYSPNCVVLWAFSLHALP
jgi:Protein of unknown function (DUF778)